MGGPSRSACSVTGGGRVGTPSASFSFVFFFNDTATTEIYTLSLHDALPISRPARARPRPLPVQRFSPFPNRQALPCSPAASRSEEHTSELQSHDNLVCR